MTDAEIEKQAKALFEKENMDPHVVWADGFTSRATIGQNTLAGVGEEVRDRYRQRVKNGDR